MDRQSVVSSNLVSIGYDAATCTLEVEFKDGRIYQYFDVPEYEYEQVLSAESVGQYFNQNIRGIYAYARL